MASKIDMLFRRRKRQSNLELIASILFDWLYVTLIIVAGCTTCYVIATIFFARPVVAMVELLAKWIEGHILSSFILLMILFYTYIRRLRKLRQQSESKIRVSELASKQRELLRPLHTP